MQTLNATVRIEKQTGKPAIFYRNEGKHMAHGLSVYTREEGHSDACVSYYRAKTRPAKNAEEVRACENLAAHYLCICEKYGAEVLKIRARLQPNYAQRVAS